MIYKPIAIPFGGGLNKDPSPEMIGDDQASILLDAFPRYTGSLSSRRFRIKQHSSVLGAQIQGVKQHLGSPLMITKSGQRLLDNFTSVYTGLHPTNLMSGLSYNNLFYFFDGTQALKYNRSDGSIRKWGMDPPTGTCTAADSGEAGNPNGTYTYKVTFATNNNESPPSPASESVTVTSKSITLTFIPVSSDPQVLYRNIYRKGGGASVYNYITTIENNYVTTYTDNTDDANVGAQLEADNYYPAPAVQVLALHFYRVYACGDTTSGQENWVWFTEEFASNPYRIEYWGPFPYENYLSIGGSDAVVSILPMFRSLVVFKNNEIHVCEGTVPAEMYITQTLSKRGCVAPFGPAIFGLPVFPSWDGVYKFNGREEERLVEFTDPLFDTGVNTSYLTKCIGIVWRGKYFLSYPETGYTYPNKILVIDLEQKAARYILDFPGTAFDVDSQGQLWAGDNDGWVRKIEQQTNTDSESLSLTYRSKKFSLAEIPGGVGGVRTVYFTALTGVSGAIVRLYIDGMLRDEKTFASTTLSPFRIKGTDHFGKYAQIEFVYNGGEEFRVLSPVVLNPPEGV